MVQRYVPDTNFFLHAKAAAELPWAELTDAARIELIVLHPVLAELESHKSKGNSRAARRSRATLTKIDRLIDDDADEVVERNDNPRVVFRLAPPLDVKRKKPDLLDLDTPDGRIVEQALAVRELLGGELTFLTQDRVPRITARAVGLPAQKVPDSWLRPPELDDRDKKIAQLEAEVRELSSREPRIELELRAGEEAIEQVAGSLVRYRTLPEPFLNRAMAAIDHRYPPETGHVMGSIMVTHEVDLKQYQIKRDRWWEQIRNDLERHGAFLTFQDGLLPVTLTVANTGTAPADGFQVDVWIEGNMKLVDVRKHQEYFSQSRLSLPKPPALEHTFGIGIAGRSLAIDAQDYMSRMYNPLQHIRPVRDVDGFYIDYDDDELVASGLKGSCAEFRHQLGGFEIPLLLTLPWDTDEKPRGCLKVRYSANNMPKPIEQVIPIKLELEWRDAEDSARKMLMDSLGVNV
ncbi:PIN domain-containing protein [Luteimonas dalianensis]|uniref:PIN domain-containing protein n=1 Tax=Luteimonas dalianensis TaxID=1148196 RepID=UPI003BF38F04